MDSWIAKQYTGKWMAITSDGAKALLFDDESDALDTLDGGGTSAGLF